MTGRVAMLGAKLKELREKRTGLSQVKFAAAANVDPSTISKLERGVDDANPTLDTLEKIAAQLGVVLVVDFVVPPAQPAGEPDSSVKRREELVPGARGRSGAKDK